MGMPPRPQGNLNRIRANVQIGDPNSQLSVVNDQLGREGIRLAFDSMATDLLATMSGMVSSPRPYQECTLTMYLVKSMPIADMYKNQFGYSTIIGTVVVYPDTSDASNASAVLSPFILNNMALENVAEMSFAGDAPTLQVTMKGYYLVNQGFFGVT